MLIFLQPRIVLLSVPKTGTTALEQALAMLRGQLAANEAQEQVEALADIQAMAKAS